MRAKKVDTTHGAIRDHLRAVGWAVRSTAVVGDNFPDLAVARRGFTALVECKSPGKTLSAGQRDFRDTWPGVVIASRDPKDAELQLDLAEKYQYLRRPAEAIEEPTSRRIEIKPPKPRDPSKLLRTLGGED